MQAPSLGVAAVRQAATATDLLDAVLHAQAQADSNNDNNSSTMIIAYQD